MKNILLFGAGKSATVLINYLLENGTKEGWILTLIDADLALAKSKIGTATNGAAKSFNIEDGAKRKEEIEKADLVISLLPAALHFLVAKDCLIYKKNLLTASYVDDQIKSLEKEIVANDLLFLCEAGLDPGIDHMSAKKLLDEIEMEGGKVSAFLSHCGGLVAPESDDNPWHYKISWNPRNVVMAGKSGAFFKKNNSLVSLAYEQLFGKERSVAIPGYQQMAWYPNRDSLQYATLYHLDDCQTFIRTTLRHPQFMTGWKNIIDLKLTDEEKVYQTDGKTLATFFKEHVERFHQSQKLAAIKEDHKGYNQLSFLGLNDYETVINKGLCSAADVLQFALEKNLALFPTDKDLVVMMHEIEYFKEEKGYKRTSTLLVKGENNRETAMAKTVGLPLGICAKMILNGTIKTKGLQIPVLKEIYDPVLNELEKNGIHFKEQTEALN